MAELRSVSKATSRRRDRDLKSVFKDSKVNSKSWGCHYLFLCEKWCGFSQQVWGHMHRTQKALKQDQWVKDT